MRHVAALVMLWTFGIWAVLCACSLGVLLYRACRIWYWERRALKAWRQVPRTARLQVVKDKIYMLTVRK